MEDMGKDRADTDYGPTPIDDIFKTECTYHPDLLRSVLKELFPAVPEIADAEIEILGNEHPKEEQEDGKETISKRYTDCVVKIRGMMYHLEAQSTSDGSILLRLTEYDLRIAMEHAVYDRKRKSLTIEIPLSGLLYFQGTGRRRKKSGSMRVCLSRDGVQLAEYDVPVMYVQAYSLEELFEKDLYFLLPFFVLRFRDELKRISRKKDADAGKRELIPIVRELEELAAGLEGALRDRKLEENKSIDIASYCKYLIGYVTRNMDEDLRKGMVEAMGGKVLEFNSESDIIARAMIKEAHRKLREKSEELEEAEKRVEEVKKRAEENEKQLETKNRQIDVLSNENARMKAVLEKAGITY